MTKAEEFFQLAEEGKKKTRVDFKYDELLSRFKSAAQVGQTEATINIYKKAAIANNLFVLSRGQSTEQDAEDAYNDQYALEEKFKADGFAVTIEKTTNIILLDNPKDESDVEATFTVSWNQEQAT